MNKIQKENRFCSKCGSKMNLIKREGHVESIGYMTGELFYYDKKFSSVTGEVLELYCCPNFEMINNRRKGWFSDDKYEFNGHDFYTEPVKDTSLCK